MVNITLQLPDELAEAAQDAGLLTTERVSAWIQSELERRRRIAELREDMRKLRALQPPLTPEEIAAEISAAREEDTQCA